MSSQVVEYVGREGVRSTPITARVRRPLPGDPIKWPNGKIGRIDEIGRDEGTWAGPGEAHVCSGLGSAFLSYDEEHRTPRVSISGGPFLTVKLDDLEFRSLYSTPFWNWGDNSPGAGQGVDYNLPRPLWVYRGASDHYSIRDES